jgi:hypothetical protein
MSADNTVVIGKFGQAYRVAHVVAAEQLEYEGIDSPLSRVTQYYEFKDSPIFHDMEKAFYHASDLEKEMKYVEYGIRVIDFDQEFPDEAPEEYPFNSQ